MNTGREERRGDDGDRYAEKVEVKEGDNEDRKMREREGKEDRSMEEGS